MSSLWRPATAAISPAPPPTHEPFLVAATYNFNPLSPNPPVVTLANPDPHTNQLKRPPLRPPVGIPLRDASRREGVIVSVLLHLLLAFLILGPPIFMATTLDFVQKEGAGGPGPAGGGGGGSGGSGGRLARERLQYLQVVTPAVQPAVPPPVVEPPKPVEKPKPDPVVPPPTPPPTLPPAEVTAAAASSDVKDASVVTGTGGGTGKDGTAGTGSGSGGGVGTGVGTGKGTGVGPGTGGGSGDVYPPAVISLPILPLPVPGKVRPYKLVAYFEVDTTGTARLLAFNPSNDGGYNKRIREMLSEIRFRPATRPDGRAVVDTAVVTAEAPR